MSKILSLHSTVVSVVSGYLLKTVSLAAICVGPALVLGVILKAECRLANSHGFTVSLTVSGIASQ